MTNEIKKAKSSLSIFNEERTELPDFGGSKIIYPDPPCKTCRYAIKGEYGYKNGHCYKYQKGKPSGILFKGASCPYYRKDRSDSDSN